MKLRLLSLALVFAALGQASAASAPGRPTPWRTDLGFLLPTGHRIVGTAPSPTGPAAIGKWTEVPRTWPVPPSGGGGAFDAARGEFLTFGGCCFQGDLWAFEDGVWRKPPPGPLAPGARASNVMAYDPVRRHTVMFGGSQYGETWVWDGTQWAIHHQINGPQFRSDAAIAWMPKLGKLVMFGGYPDVDPNEIGSQLEDTWAWSGSGWEAITTATTPPARYAAGVAADPATGNLVLFGGLSDTYVSLADTWIFDGVDWRAVQTPVTPEKRSYPAMAANPAVGAVELFGGYALEQGYVALADRWFFVDGEWTQELPGIANGPLPPPRFGGELEADGAGRMLLFGGTCDPTCGGVWTERLEVVEHEDGSVTRTLVWDETPSPWPVDRMSAGTMVQDPLGRGTLMHGGFGDSTGMRDPNDTWLWDGEWRELKTEGAPPGRQAGSLAVHRGTKTVVLFGGPISYNTIDPRTWVLDGDRWEAASPAVSPPVRYQAAMSEDPNGDVVLFGGLGQGGTSRLGDTWVWDGETWRQHQGPGPSPRASAQMAYDPVRKETVLFGGSIENGVTLPETWIWDGAGWEQRTPPTTPAGKLGAAMTWDPAGEQIVLFGGATCASAGCLVTNEVWTWDGVTWLRHDAPMGGPGARWFSVAGPTEGGIVMFGGHAGGSGLPLSDTWLWTAISG